MTDEKKIDTAGLRADLLHDGPITVAVTNMNNASTFWIFAIAVGVGVGAWALWDLVVIAWGALTHGGKARAREVFRLIRATTPTRDPLCLGTAL